MRYLTAVLYTTLITVPVCAQVPAPETLNSGWEVYVGLAAIGRMTVSALNEGPAMWGASYMLTDSISGTGFSLASGGNNCCTCWPSACECWPNGFDFINNIDSSGQCRDSSEGERYLPYGLFRIDFQLPSASATAMVTTYSIYLDLRDDRFEKTETHDIWIRFSTSQNVFDINVEGMDPNDWDEYSPGSTVEIWKYFQDTNQYTSAFQPTTPQNLVVAWDPTYTHPQLNWTSSEPASAVYNIYRRTRLGAYTQIASYYSGNSYLDTQISCGLQTYYYKVIAVSGDHSKQSPGYAEQSFNAACALLPSSGATGTSQTLPSGSANEFVNGPNKSQWGVESGIHEQITGIDTTGVVFWPNTIRSFLWNDGLYFTVNRPPTGAYNEGLFWPGSTNKNMVFAAGPWISGKDETGQARASTSFYQTDFQPGKIVRLFSDTNYTSAAAAPHDSAYYISMLSDTSSSGSIDYERWVKDASLTGAPLNYDGTPKLYGNLNAYWVMNDLDSATMLQLHPYQPSMGIEVQNYVFAFDSLSPPPLDRTIFVDMKYINRSAHAYDSCYVGWFNDIDLGDYNTNLDGCDTMLSLGYMYCARDTDDVYGFPPPACGFVVLRGPGISSTGEHMTSFYKEHSGTQLYEMPSSGTESFSEEAFWELSGRNFLGNRIFPTGDTVHAINYVDPGDPVTGSGWIDPTNLAGDERLLMGSGPFAFHPGDTVELAVAFVVGLGTDRMNSVTVLKSYIPKVRQKWESAAAVESGRQPPSIPSRYDISEGYPNPFNPSISFRMTLPEKARIEVIVYDILGREIRILRQGEYAAGTYWVMWDGRNIAGMPVSSGTYFCSMRVYPNHGAASNLVRKVALLK